MKKVPMLCLIAAPYVFAIAAAAIVVSEGGITAVAFEGVLRSYALTCLIVYVPASVYAFLLPRLGFSPRQIAFWAAVLKLGAAPFFAVLFVLMALFAFMLFTIPLAIVLSAIGYVSMLPSGLYCISGIVQARKRGALGTMETVVGVLFQFLPVFDVAAALCVFASVRSSPLSVR